MAVLPRDIEITENGTPEHNRVKMRTALNNMNHVHYKKRRKRDGKTSAKNYFDFFV